MNFKTPLEIEIYYNTESSKQLESLGIESVDGLLEPIMGTFYSIQVIMPTSVEDNKACVVSGGEVFYTPYDYKELTRIVNKHINK